MFSVELLSHNYPEPYCKGTGERKEKLANCLAESNLKWRGTLYWNYRKIKHEF
jgi:hypothetical protein